MRDRLCQALDELLRLESEGRPPATAVQEREVAEIDHTIDRINHLIQVLEGAPMPFTSCQQHAPEAWRLA